MSKPSFKYKCDVCSEGIIDLYSYNGPIIQMVNPHVRCGNCRSDIFRYVSNDSYIKDVEKITWQALMGALLNHEQ